MPQLTIEQRREWLRNLKPGDKVASKNGVCDEFVIHTVIRNLNKSLVTTGFYDNQELHFDNETGDVRVNRSGVGRIILVPVTDEVIAKNIANKIVHLVEFNRRQLCQLPLSALAELLASVQNAVNYIPKG